MVAAILLITMLQVVLRYVFSIALPWSADTAQILLVYTVTLVAGAAVGSGKHFSLPMAVDVCPAPLARLLRKTHDILISVFAVTMIVFGTRFAFAQMGTKLPALGIPVGVVYLALPLGAVTMLVFCLIRIFAHSRGEEPAIGNSR